MKRLLFSLLLLLVFSETRAQINSEHIKGSWKLMDESPVTTYKIISEAVIATVKIDTVTRRVVSTVLGSYMVNPTKGVGNYNDLGPDSCVISELFYVNDSVANVYASRTATSGIKLENHDLLYTTSETQGRQKWARIDNKLYYYFNQAVLNKPDTAKSSPLLSHKELNSKKFYVLKSRTKSVFVKPNASFLKPFAFLKEDQIEEIEDMAAPQAVKMYGESAHFGAVVITVYDDYYPVALKVLKAQKNVE